MSLPREKLIEQGPEQLTNEELLAIILGTGTKREDVFSLSKRLIKPYDNDAFCKIRSVKQIQSLWNVGLVHACRLLSLKEFALRIFQKNPKKRIFRKPSIVAEHLSFMRKLEQEQCRVLYLSTQNSLLAEEIISIGSINASILHPREVFKPAFHYHAASIIVAHNHPSGDPYPSPEDLKITEEIKKAGSLLRIPLLDHLIIGEKYFFSFEAGEQFKLRKIDQS